MKTKPSLLYFIALLTIDHYLPAHSQYTAIFFETGKGTVQEEQTKQRKKKRPVQLSLIIPCHYKHAIYLHPLLEAYAQQTIFPDEVVIALSEWQKANTFLLDRVTAAQWPFKVKTVLIDHQQTAGENRNSACSNATGNVLVCQDADDIPHPQRIEIIKYFFENYIVDHLLHTYTLSNEQLATNWGEKIDPKSISVLWQRIPKAARCAEQYHNGNIAISSRVFRRIKWSSKNGGEDNDFNDKVFKFFKRAVAINIPLIRYRSDLSAHKHKNYWKYASIA